MTINTQIQYASANLDYINDYIYNNPEFRSSYLKLSTFTFIFPKIEIEEIG